MTKLGLYGTAIVVPDSNRLPSFIQMIHPANALVPWMHFGSGSMLPSSNVWGKKLGAIRFVGVLEYADIVA